MAPSSALAGPLSMRRRLRATARRGLYGVKHPGFAVMQAFSAWVYCSAVPLQLAPLTQSIRLCLVEHVEALQELVQFVPVTAVWPGLNLFVHATTALHASWHEVLPQPLAAAASPSSVTASKRFMVTSSGLSQEDDADYTLRKRSNRRRIAAFDQGL